MHRNACPRPRRVCASHQRRAPFTVYTVVARHTRRHATPRGARADAQVGVLSMWWLRDCSRAQISRLSPLSEKLSPRSLVQNMSTGFIRRNHASKGLHRVAGVVLKVPEALERLLTHRERAAAAAELRVSHSCRPGWWRWEHNAITQDVQTRGCVSPDGARFIIAAELMKKGISTEKERSVSWVSPQPEHS